MRLLVLSMVLVAGCGRADPLLFRTFDTPAGGDTTPADMRPPTSPDPKPDPKLPPVANPIVGGGTTGEPLQGALTVFVIDRETSDVISGADVLLQTSSGNQAAKTNEVGRVYFVAPDIEGKANVHVSVSGYEISSLVGLTADQVTVALVLREDLKPEYITTSGRVTGWEKLSEPDSRSTRLGVVRASGLLFEDLSPQSAQRPRPGTQSRGNPDGIAYNILLEGNRAAPVYTDYQLQHEASAKSLVVTAGIYPFEDPEDYKPDYIGFINRGLSDETGLVLTHKLDQNMQLELTGAPDLSDRSGGAFVTVPNDGGAVVFFTGELSRGGRLNTVGPSLNGGLESGTLGMYAFLSEEDDDGANRRTSYAIERGGSADFRVSDMLDPPTDLTTEGRALQAKMPPDANATFITIADTDDETIWTVLITDGTSPFALPWDLWKQTFPGDGTVDLTISAGKLAGVDFSQFEFRRLQSVLTRRSSRTWTVRYEDRGD